MICPFDQSNQYGFLIYVYKIEICKKKITKVEIAETLRNEEKFRNSHEKYAHGNIQNF